MKIIPPYRGELDYTTPKEGQLLKIKLNPDGLHDVIDPFEFNGDEDGELLIRHRLGFLRMQNLKNGFNGEFEPTFTIVNLKTSTP